MFQLIYTSTAARKLDRDDLRELVENARNKNARLGITGVLVHRNGSFLQVLEGDDEETVRQLYSTIRADERHRWVTVLKTSSLEVRDFPEDPMTFRERSLAGARASHTAEAPAEDGQRGKESPAREALLQFQRVEGPSSSSEPPPDEGLRPQQ